MRENHSIPRYVRLAALPRFNSSMVRAPGTDLLTVRIDLDPARTDRLDGHERPASSGPHLRLITASSHSAGPAVPGPLTQQILNKFFGP